MHIEQVFLDLCHIAIGGMNLVDHQQTARQGRRAQMGVLDLQGGQHGLIDGPHGNRCGQRSLDAFRRPAGQKLGLVGAIVIPAYLPVGQPLPFGLAGYIFTNDLSRATRAAEDLEVGMVGINEMLLATAEAPFGGIKESGIGREGGSLGIQDYLEPKYVKARLKAVSAA